MVLLAFCLIGAEKMPRRYLGGLQSQLSYFALEFLPLQSDVKKTSSLKRKNCRCLFGQCRPIASAAMAVSFAQFLVCMALFSSQHFLSEAAKLMHDISRNETKVSRDNSIEQ